MIAAILSGSPVAGFDLPDGARVVFLGDSNTAAGPFVQDVEAFLFARFPDRRYEIINLGLPSETISGTSEADHPFPRPDVHERLDRALARTKPDVVVVCYGMNDGIYAPFDEGTFAKYRAGVEKLVDRAGRAGASVVLITPPPFDPAPIRAATRPAGAVSYSYKTPFVGYNDTLGRYAEYLRTWQGRGPTVVDGRAAVDRTLAALRAVDPGASLAGDGIHLDAHGHRAIAEALLAAWDAPGEVDSAEITVEDATARAIRGRIANLAVDRGGVRFDWTTRVPTPRNPERDPRFAAGERRSAERFDRHRVTVTGLGPGRYLLAEGDRTLGPVDREGLAAGIDLLAYPDLSTNRRAVEIWKLVVRRERLLASAWLAEVGHKRPGGADAPPLAEAEPRAAGIEREIRDLSRPVPLDLRVIRRAD